MPSRLKKGDIVIVISGKDGGRKGKVLKASDGFVVIEKMNIAKRHQRPSKNFQGGIIEKPMPITTSKVMLYCAKCDKGVRVKSVKVDDKNLRKCAKCEEVLDKVK